MEAIRRNLALLEAVFSVEQFLLEDFDQRSFLNKLESVMQLVRRGATEGERQAGKMALERLRSRAEQEMKSMSRREIESLRDAIKRITSNDKPEQPQPRPQSRPEPPRDKPAMFRMGQWIVVKEDNRVGKIVEIRRNRFDNSYTYTVKMSDSASHEGTELYNESLIRAATQEDLDAAVSKRPTVQKFPNNGYVFCLDDNKVGKVVDTGWDRSTHSRWYTIDFLDGGNDMIEEQYLRDATRQEVEYQRRKYSKKSSTGGSGGNNDVQAFARYINPAQNSNKVYGVVKREGKYYTFWGGYGKTLSIKQFQNLDDAMLQYRTKELSGYKQVPPLGEAATWIDNALNARFAKLDQ